MSLTEITKILGRHSWWMSGSPGETRDAVAGDLRTPTVTADDGIRLHVEVTEAPDADATVVFCHGFLLNSTSWRVERDALAGRVRVVLWDLRGHGRSGWGSPPNATIDQLGRDLFAVLREAAPEGPVVLVGHSMGGMAILGLADAHPELFGDRIVGVLLASTSSGDLSSVTIGLPERTARVLHRMVPVTLSTLRHQARLVDAARRPLGGMSFLLTRSYLFGAHVSRQVAEVTTRLMASVPIEVIATFYTELIAYDKRAALPGLGRVPVLVMVGDRDLITPMRHAEALAAQIPGADLVVIPGAGHLLPLERAAEVNHHLWNLLRRTTGIEPAAEPALVDGHEQARRHRRPHLHLNRRGQPGG
ncbi:alpha/beta fold hydrolase [Actinoallomurus rhizosphaericola]|uniref:alpha/beta fold hydrolase n=1 Tax=Actinoallomurus rhizosphaericola TaxID=2952536 RepID=UPI002093F2D7|nr:alpha/beta fold hydrolase [Actinoallomurus rhizosphaericola]MCO5998579.1 alpha/beta hydrolase [Actinoallomurus rhizosphaericola]